MAHLIVFWKVGAVDLARTSNVRQLASAADATPTLPFDQGSEGMLMMMRGMTAKNFDPVRYSGRWFEVASLKRGFAGQGQEDCHCTQVHLLRKSLYICLLLLLIPSVCFYWI